MKPSGSSYSSRARLQPALLAALPLSALSVAVFVARPAWWSSLVAVAGASGISALAAQIARSAGRAKEPSLWRSWGGPPTTSALRHRSATNPTQLRRYHEAIERTLGISLPSSLEESNDPATADQTYEIAVKGLIERTREVERFPVVFEELCGYGFRRNLYGLRPAAIVACVVSLLGCVVGILIASGEAGDVQAAPFVVVAILDVLELAFLWRFVTSEWVRDASTTYARALLGATENL